MTNLKQPNPDDNAQNSGKDNSTQTNKLSRRKFLIAAGAIAVAGGGAAIFRQLNFNDESSTPLEYTFPTTLTDSGVTIKETPSCDDGDETLSEIEGPFYTPNTPQRNRLIEEGMKGTVLMLAGRVLDTNCKPIAGAVIDFWQADSNGNYDNQGFNLRGHQFTDKNGIYWLETVKPAPYNVEGTWRTPHLHVKVQGQNTKLLTTQIFFPDEAENNDKDDFYSDDLLMALSKGSDDSLAGEYTFVLRNT